VKYPYPTAILILVLMLVAQDSILAYPSPFYKANIECWATILAFFIRVNP